MSYDFLKDFDGSTRKPRDIQIKALTWISENWDSTKIFVLNAPVGSGKSSIARAVQRKVGGFIVTPSNILVDQYLRDFPTVNHLIGKSHYQCKMGMSCKDWTDVLEQKPCENCTYACNREKAKAMEPTFFNPISLYYISSQTGFKAPKVVIVDEAHQLEGMLLEMCGVSLKRSEHPFTDKCLNELFLLEFLKSRIASINRLIVQKSQLNDFKALNILSLEQEKLKFTILGLQENAQNYAIWIDEKLVYGKKETVLNVKPLFVPRQIVNKVLCGTKIILMSGTISPLDLKNLIGEDADYKYMELDSPIPKENRPVHFRPINARLNRDTDPKIIVEAIESVIKDNPGLNTIVHITYSMSAKLVPHFTIPIIYNKTSQDKDAKLQEFRNEGGVLIAAGMAEGIDLPGDLCRLNIVPKLLYPDLGDKIVQKKLATEGGELWYNMETFKKLLQQIGRSTRGTEDYSKTYILDPGFSYRFKQYKSYLPKYFTESIIWTR